MSLLTRYASLIDASADAFAQKRTADRSLEFSLALPACVGRRTITAALCALGQHDVDWSGGYKFFNRADWNPAARFRPVLEHFVELFASGPIPIAVDDTKGHKVGKKIRSAFWQRHPLSPPFHTNLTWAQRFLHFSLIFPLHRKGSASARSIPIRFRDAPVVKKPGIRGTDAQWEEWHRRSREQNLSTQARTTALEIRRELDELGQAHRWALLVADGSFCNRAFFREALDRIHILARTRKDARLCLPAAENSRRTYDPNLFTPESVRKNDTIPWQQTKIFFGGKKRNIRFKHVDHVLWRRGAGPRLLRLIVVAPVPYKLSPNARVNYRQPAYLLTDDPDSSPTSLLQSYFDRWQIEVNHRDIKTNFGAAEAQVHSLKAVPRVPEFVVSCYSLLLLAALLEFGPSRINAYGPLPKWRRPSARPSVEDILRRLRQDLDDETRDSPSPLSIRAKTLALSRAA